MTHDWGPSRLNHGSAQCTRCLCTWEEAHFAGLPCIEPKPRSLPLGWRVIEGGKR